MNFIKNLYQGAIGRLLRVALASAAAAYWTAHHQDRVFVEFQAAFGAGSIAALGKYLRDRWPGALSWIPF